MAYKIVNRDETYHVADNGDISRPKIGLLASGSWKMTGLVRFNNFGRAVEIIPFSKLQGFLAAHGANGSFRATHKNGKTQWFVRDTDHGTQRIQMSPGLLEIQFNE